MEIYYPTLANFHPLYKYNLKRITAGLLHNHWLAGKPASLSPGASKLTRRVTTGGQAITLDGYSNQTRR
jgi:hypothetical protein